MATISRIVALPSATQYTPTSPPYPQFTADNYFNSSTPFSWGQVSYGGTPTNTIFWAEPSLTSSYKNQTSAQYRFILSRVSDGVVIRDGLLGSFNVPQATYTTDLGSGLIAGTQYTVSTYTLANGSRSDYSTNWTFYAMTAPDSSPSMDGPYSGYGGGGYANSINGNQIDVTISTDTANWGGSSALGDRFYEIQLLRENGSVGYTAKAYAVSDPNKDATNITVPLPRHIIAKWPGANDGTGGVGPEKLTVWVQALNRAGAAPRVANPTSAAQGPTVIFPVAPPLGQTVSPSSGPGGGGYTITISGYYLNNASSVSIGGISASIVSSTFNDIIINAPLNISSTGLKNVVITTPGGTQTMTNAFNFTTNVPPFFPFFGPFFPFFSCVQGDTLIKTIDGYSKARDIYIGQKLYSYSFDQIPVAVDGKPQYNFETWTAEQLTNANLVETTVKAIKSRIVPATVIFNNDTNKRFSLEHIILIKRDNTYMFVQSGVIKQGDYLIYDINNNTNEVLVDSIEYLNEETDVYEITLSPYDLFIAGDIVVHNKKLFFQGPTNKDIIK